MHGFGNDLGDSAEGDRLNVGTGTSQSINRLLDAVLAEFGTRRDQYPVTEKPELPGDQREVRADTTLADRVLGWRSSVSFEDGLTHNRLGPYGMAQPDRRLLALSVRSTSPGQRFRIQQWASFLSAEGIETVEHAFASPALERVLDSQDELGVKLRETARSWATYRRHFPALSQMDAALIFREAVPIGPDLALRRLRGWQGPIAFDVDDPIFLGPGGDTSAAMRAIRPHKKWQRLCRMSQVTLAINRPIAAKC